LDISTRFYDDAESEF